MSEAGVRLGLTLPSFVTDPGIPLDVARAADEVGLDGVFVYDHLFRVASDGARRPALEGVALLGAVAGATTRVAVGTLVLRASLRPPASLAAAVATVARIAPDRVIAAIGAGDSESEEENESFGLGFGTMEDRVATLAAAVRAGRDHGATVWVGGTAAPVRAVASADADGWNVWGGSPDAFAAHVAEVRAAATRQGFACTWGGLVVLDADDRSARTKAERLGAGAGTIVGGPATVAATLQRYVDAGADWVVLAPVDSQDPANADRVAAVGRALRSRPGPGLPPTG